MNTNLGWKYFKDEIIIKCSLAMDRIRTEEFLTDNGFILP
jgi:hypothetical protein